MTVGRDDAMLLLSKWFSEETLLECRASFPFLATAMRGRLREFSPDKGRFESDDRTLVTAFSLRDIVGYSFGDVDDFVTPTGRFEGTLVLIYRLSDSAGEASDTITLSEVAAAPAK